MAFRGHYEHSLDAKNRLSIPAKFRPPFADGLVLSPDPGGFLNVSSADVHQQRVQGAVAGHNPLSQNYQRIIRWFDANSFDTELDSAGRVVVPSELRAHAGFEKEVVVAGVFDHLELWSADGWQEEQRQLARVVGEVTESLGHPSA